MLTLPTHFINYLYKGNKKSFQWTTTCQQAFDALKAKLTTPPVLGYPDFTCPFVLHSDASHCAIGAVLSQRQNGQEIVISYRSQRYNSIAKFKSPSMLFQEGIVEVSLAILD